MRAAHEDDAARGLANIAAARPDEFEKTLDPIECESQKTLDPAGSSCRQIMLATRGLPIKYRPMRLIDAQSPTLGLLIHLEHTFEASCKSHLSCAEKCVRATAAR